MILMEIVMANNTEKCFQIGRDKILDAIDEIAIAGSKIPNINENLFKRDALAGAMTCLMDCVYAMAPTEEMAEELISFAQKTSAENWEKEKNA